MSRSALFKVEGAGNDFVLGLGAWAERLAADAALAATLCRRGWGIGADGVLAVSAAGSHRARLVYRNADGSEAAFCANGTRCAARAASELLGLGPTLTVVTGWGDIPATVAGSRVSLELPPPATAPRAVELVTAAGTWAGSYVVVGVPHLVVPWPELEALDLAAVAPALRRHPDLGPDGANVSFVARRPDRALAIRSWERGVEGETLCCGSGVVAAALLTLAADGGRELVVVPRSGDRLEVTALAAPPVSATRLTGPARIVAEIVPGPDLTPAS